MQLSSRGPSGPGHRARLLSWKDHPRRGRYGLPTRRAGAIRRPTPNTTPPPPSTSIRCHAYGEKGTEDRPRRAGLDIRARATGRAGRQLSSQPARGTPSGSARRPDRLAFYMGYCPHRRTGHVSCGTRDGRTLSRRRARPTRLLVVAGRRLAGAGPDARVSSAAGVYSSAHDALAPRAKAAAVRCVLRGTPSAQPHG